MAVVSIVPKIGCVPRALYEWVKQHQVDSGMREGVSTAEQQRVEELEREVKELRRANEILKLASAFFALAGSTADSTQVMYEFEDEHRNTHGVEPICTVLQVALAA